MNDTLNIKELSKYLKCSVSGVRNLVRDKRIPYFRVGNRLFFKTSSIDLWIANQEISNMQDSAYEAKIKALKRNEVKSNEI